MWTELVWPMIRTNVWHVWAR